MTLLLVEAANSSVRKCPMPVKAHYTGGRTRSERQKEANGDEDRVRDRKKDGNGNGNEDGDGDGDEDEGSSGNEIRERKQGRKWTRECSTEIREMGGREESSGITRWKIENRG